MRLAVFRYANGGQCDRLVGLVDPDGEAQILGIPTHPEDAEPDPQLPHEYVPDPSGVEMRSGRLCKCSLPREHQIHRESDPDDEQLPESVGPIQIKVHQPIELYTLVMPMESAIGAPGFGIVTVPNVLRQSYVFVHFERTLTDGIYDLEPEQGQELEGIVADYLGWIEAAKRAGGPAPLSAEPGPRTVGGRRRIDDGR